MKQVECVTSVASLAIVMNCTNSHNVQFVLQVHRMFFQVEANLKVGGGGDLGWVQAWKCSQFCTFLFVFKSVRKSHISFFLFLPMSRFCDFSPFSFGCIGKYFLNFLYLAFLWIVLAHLVHFSHQHRS